MKVLFMGTPDFAVPSLQALVDADHAVVGVVTQPDAPRDRGKKVKYSPVKEAALKLDLPVWQPETLRENQGFQEEMASLAPDLAVVAAYGKLLPPSFLQLPRLGCINVHASLLPRHRGAAPIQQAILDGDPFTGITIMQMAEGMDTGDMIATRRTPIGDKNAGQLHEELAQMGAAMLPAVLEDLLRGTATLTPQEEALATYAPMIRKEDGRLDLSGSAQDVLRRIRAMSPWPGATLGYGDQTMKIWDGFPVDRKGTEPIGTVLQADEEGILVVCGDGAFCVTELQMPGKKRVRAADYLRGNAIDKSKRLG